MIDNTQYILLIFLYLQLIHWYFRNITFNNILMIDTKNILGWIPKDLTNENEVHDSTKLFTPSNVHLEHWCMADTAFLINHSWQLTKLIMTYMIY